MRHTHKPYREIGAHVSNIMTEYVGLAQGSSSQFGVLVLVGGGTDERDLDRVDRVA